jgi:large subunit ribosomal protein L25
MSQSITLDAQPRSDFGKGAARSARRAGRVPAVVYGSGGDVLHLTLPGHELDLALRVSHVVLNIVLDGETTVVAPVDVQRDPVRTDLLHVDLLRLDATEVKQRHAFADALARAEAAAAEADLDPVRAAAIIESAAANDEDLETVAANIVSILQEQARAEADQAQAAAAAEDAAAAGEAEPAE